MADARSYWANKRLSRRGFVRGGALGAVTFGLAGCAAQPPPPTAAPTTAAVGAAALTAAPAAVPPNALAT